MIYTATVGKDVNINSYPPGANEFETNVNEHNFVNSDTQDVEWSDWIRTEEEFTWTVIIINYYMFSIKQCFHDEQDISLVVY